MDVSQFINAPRQSRSLRSHNQILDAASRLLEDGAFDDISVAQISAKAGLSTGAFYARFVSKRAVLYAIQSRYLTALRQDINRLVEAAKTEARPFREVAQVVFLLIASGGLATRGVMHAVTSEGTRDGQVMRNIASFSADLAAVFSELDGHAASLADLTFATRACIATLQQEWLYPERMSADDLDVLSSRLADLLVRYLHPIDS